MSRRSPSPPRFVVVTGFSGAGKSQAIRALEDLGYFCVDNLPVALIPTFADLVHGRNAAERAAVVVDVRERRGLAELPKVMTALRRRKGLKPQLLFLDADDETLLRRFSETRRPHPLAKNRSAKEGLTEERRALRPIKKLADRTIDTSKLNVHELRRAVAAFATGSPERQPMTVTVTSFSFRRGVPPDADLVFDVRFLKNPFFVPSLKRLTGLDARVSRYVLQQRAAQRFLTLSGGLLRFLLPQYLAEGKAYLTVAVGCTGGQHRSVAVAEALGRQIGRWRGAKARVQHREMES